MLVKGQAIARQAVADNKMASTRVAAIPCNSAEQAKALLAADRQAQGFWGMFGSRRRVRVGIIATSTSSARLEPFMARLHYVIRAEEAKMANVFVESRPKGKPEGSPITDYIVEDRADNVLGSFRTQEAATHWARIHGHSPHVARVRHLNDKDKPDHWRKV
jgi:hypothetical protein